MSRNKSISELSLGITGMFEAELLVALMLRHWGHPLASDQEFAGSLLESAAEVLRAAVSGEKVIEELSPENVNLVAAICLAELTSLGAYQEVSPNERAQREQWIATVRRAVPSCFCDPDLLP